MPPRQEDRLSLPEGRGLPPTSQAQSEDVSIVGQVGSQRVLGIPSDPNVSKKLHPDGPTIPLPHHHWPKLHDVASKTLAHARHRHMMRGPTFAKLKAHKHYHRHSLDPTRDRRTQFRIVMAIVCWIPSFAAVWWAAAIFFPPQAHLDFPALLLTAGAWISTPNSTHPVEVVPHMYLAAQGYFQIFLLIVARLTAFPLYVAMGNTFLSKCHGLMHALSQTKAAYDVPLERMHHLHKFTGACFASCATAHTIAHLVRWGVRQEMRFCHSAVGLTGIIAMALMVLVVVPMFWYRLKVPKVMSFETRFNMHWLFLPMLIALFMHASRTFYIMVVFSGIWALDYAYVYFFRTFRLDFVEFTRLSDGGVQMLWHNPKGFHPHAGEYVKILIPWLHKQTENGVTSHAEEWHAFSLYMAEATSEGLSLARLSSSEDFNAKPPTLDSAVVDTLWHGHVHGDDPEHASLVRRGGKIYGTTQVFVMPIGDWSKV